MNNLATELLLKILLYVLHEETDRTQGEATPRMNAWVKYTHVCTRWRNLIFDSRTLVRPVTITSIDALRGLLHVFDAKKALLSVAGSLNSEDLSELDWRKLRCITDHSSRLLALNLRLTTMQLRRLWWFSFDPMLLLEELTLEREWSTAEGEDESERMLLTHFVSNHLRKVHLTNFGFRAFELLLCSSITDLCLCGRFDLSTAEILWTLQRTPNIRHLDIRIGITGSLQADDEQAPQPAISLPYLKTLLLLICEATAGEFLYAVDAPQLECVDLFLSCPFNDYTTLSGMVERVQGKVNCIAAAQRYQTCTLYQAERQSMHFFLADEMYIVGGGLPDHRIYLTFDGHTSGTWQDRTEEAVLSVLRNSLEPCLREVTRLHVDVTIADGEPYSGSAISAWHDLLLLMENVETVRLSGHGITIMPSGLVYCGQRTNISHPIFPNIRTMALEWVMFRTSRSTDDVDNEILAALLRSFELRFNAINTNNLTISRCINVTQEDIDHLRRTIANVEWDGVELEYGYYGEE